MVIQSRVRHIPNARPLSRAPRGPGGAGDAAAGGTHLDPKSGTLYIGRVRIIARKTLVDFWRKHADAAEPLRAWFTEAKSSAWKSPADVKRRYPAASFLSDNRIVFNVKGNRYRLVVHMRYDLGRVYIRFVGTHAEYDGIDAASI